MSEVPVPRTVSLRQVAGWDLKHLNAPCEIQVGVPALQRGLVWDPARVEVLWDSIFRGFPIGCLVVSRKVQTQLRDDQSTITHHLLDGQQRCNAITLGFHDPFDGKDDEVRGNQGDAILWLDLAPHGNPQFPARIPKNSTREFLFRVTNRAHPWGYDASDRADRISHRGMKESLRWRKVSASANSERPSPAELRPYESNAPVPLSWLIRAAEATRAEADFWRSIQGKLNALKEEYPWAAEALKIVAADKAMPPGVYQGLLRATRTMLVVIETPSNLADPSSREAVSPGDQSEGISNVEHLFTRLNQQGVRLDGEELAYSLIKAYWPEVAPAIESIPHRRIPESKLAALAIRAALTTRAEEKLASANGISQIRAMANPHANDPRQLDRRDKVLNYLKASHGEAGTLASACSTVDRWLSFDLETNPHGLPPVLVSSIARSSPDIYLLLLVLAGDPEVLSAAEEPAWKRATLGLVTLVHWFGDDKARIANAVWASCRQDAGTESIRQGLRHAVDNKWLAAPLGPRELERHLQIPEDEAGLKNWRWWHSLIGSKPAAAQDEWSRYLWSTVGKTSGNRGLLLYAQRRYLAKRFPDYDPSRKDLWENHNRPWDFDHIHAHAYFYNKKDGSPFREVCGEFGNVIGNLRAWPMEDNRSDQMSKANDKMSGQQVEDSLVLPGELDSFSHGDASRWDVAKAGAFCRASRDRYLRIYADWYESTGIGDLVCSPVQPTAASAESDLQRTLPN